MGLHIGIILDGNRRWAKKRGLPTLEGHTKGAEAIGNLLKGLDNDNLGIDILTVYAFSTENWNREKKEVDYLMLLLEKYLQKLYKVIKDKEVKVNILGDKTKLNSKLQKEIEKIENDTKDNTRFIFNMCINYGGRDEIIKAVQKIIDENIKKEDITEETFKNYLYTGNMPDVDLIIRTSNENRTSGFLTYQGVYSELLFIDEMWPEFTIDTMKKCLNEYESRNRRYGK